MAASTEIVHVAQASPSAALTKETLKLESERRMLLAQFIQAEMTEDTDFGKIPGTQKPTLLKPGAEKLTELFRCTPKYKLVKIEEDFEKGFFNYIFRVQLYQRDSGAVLAEGYGSANSREGRYRWRDAQRKCPACNQPTIFASKHAKEFYCWTKKGGCGAKFREDDKGITDQVQGRIENDDIATLANTILKMAKKRALVDGAIALARCSDLFTQDVEDFAHPEPEPEPRRQPERQEETGRRSAPANTSAKQAPPPAETKRGFHVTDVKTGESEEQAKAREAAEMLQMPRPGQSANGGLPSCYEQIRIAAGEFGLENLTKNPKALQAAIKGTTGKSSSLQLTALDVAKMKAEFEKAAAAGKKVEALNQPSSPPAREPGSDDDVPF